MEDFSAKLNELVEDYGTQNQEGIKDALRLAQATFGFVSGHIKSQIALAFDVSENSITALLKFMPSIKQQKVDYEVVCCLGGRCGSKDAIGVLSAFKKAFGISLDSKTPDGKIYLTSQNCFKRCGQGPNVKINNTFFGGLDSKSASLLAQRVLNGEAID